MRRAVSASIGTGRKPAAAGQVISPVTGFLFREKCPEGGREHRGYAVDPRSRRRLGRRIVVAHIGVSTNPRDGLLSGDLTRQETVHATADRERPFVLKI